MAIPWPDLNDKVCNSKKEVAAVVRRHLLVKTFSYHFCLQFQDSIVLPFNLAEVVFMFAYVLFLITL